jgi:hypothetical protein
LGKKGKAEDIGIRVKGKGLEFVPTGTNFVKVGK